MNKDTIVPMEQDMSVEALDSTALKEANNPYKYYHITTVHQKQKVKTKDINNYSVHQDSIVIME